MISKIQILKGMGIQILIVLFLIVSNGFIQCSEEDSLIKKAMDFSLKGKFDEAINAYNEAIQINPQSMHAYRHRGLVYKLKGNLDQAIADYSKAIEIKSDFAVNYLHRGKIYFEKGNLEEAISDYTKTIEIEFKADKFRLDMIIGEAYLNRGIAYKSKGDSQQSISDLNKAIEFFNKFIEKYPGDYNSHTYRGLAYQNKGNVEQAIADYNKAIETCPDCTYAYANRAEAYFLRQEYDKSWEDVHKREASGHKVSIEFLKELKKASGRER